MKDFDIAKYLREHQLGSYGILNHYVDLKPLNETTDDKLIFSTKDPISIDKISKELQAAGIEFEKKVDNPNGYVKFYVKDANDLTTAKDAIKGKPGEIKYFKPLKEYVPSVDKQREIEEDYAECIRNAKNEEEIGFCKDSYFHRTGHPAHENAYKGSDHPLTGNGEGDEFEQAETVSEEDSMGSNRFMDIGGNSIEQAIIRLKDSGFDSEDIENVFNILMSNHFEDESGMEDEETFSEGYTNKLDFPAMETTIQSIVDDLVDDGFPVEEVEQHLKDLISNAVAPYK